MRQPRSWLQRLLALAFTVVFLVTVGAGPAAAKGFSSGSKSSSSSSRSFSSSSKSSSSKAPSTSKSSTSKPSTSSGSRSFSSTAPKTGSSSSSGGYSSSSKSYSSGTRSFSSTFNPFSSSKTTTPKAPPAPPPYDTSKTTYSKRPPIVIIGSSPYDYPYMHDLYWGRPWYWRMWHSPTYDNGYWAINWVPVVVGAIFLWILVAVVISNIQRRRRY